MVNLGSKFQNAKRSAASSLSYFFERMSKLAFSLSTYFDSQSFIDPDAPINKSKISGIENTALKINGEPVTPVASQDNQGQAPVSRNL